MDTWDPSKPQSNYSTGKPQNKYGTNSQWLQGVHKKALPKPKSKYAPPKPQYEYSVKIQGLPADQTKDLRLILGEEFPPKAFKFCPVVRRATFMEVHFTTQEFMDRGIQIILDNPLGLKLSVFEAQKISDAINVPSEDVVDCQTALPCLRELTEEECCKKVAQQEDSAQKLLKKLHNNVIGEVTAYVKDRSDGYFFKVESIRPAVITQSASECFLTFAGVDEAGRFGIGYEALGSNIPSYMPRSPLIQKLFKVCFDFMVSSGKPFFDPKKTTGYWHSLLIHSNHVGQCMVVVVAHCAKRADQEPLVEPIKSELLKRLQDNECEVKSFHLRTVRKETDKTSMWYPLYGDEQLEEEVAGVKMFIYRNSYWSDGGCTQQLCDAVIHELGINDNTGVVELGFATGLMCVYLAKHCKMVCSLTRRNAYEGLAKNNYDLNCLKNFIVKFGHVQESMDIFKKHLSDCDTACAVLTESISNHMCAYEISLIQKSLWIKKVAYVMASDIVFSSAFKLLCTAERSSDPFILVKAIPFEKESSTQPNILYVLERVSVVGDCEEKSLGVGSLPKCSEAPDEEAKDRAEVRPANVGVSVTESSEPAAKKAKLNT